MDRVEEEQLEGVRDACVAMLSAASADRVSVWVLDARAGTVSPLVAAGRSIPPADVARRWSRLPVGDVGFVADVLRSRQPASVSDVRVESSVPAGLGEEIRHLIALGRPVGGRRARRGPRSRRTGPQPAGNRP